MEWLKNAFLNQPQDKKRLKSISMSSEHESMNYNNSHLFLNLHFSKPAGIVLPRL